MGGSLATLPIPDMLIVSFGDLVHKLEFFLKCHRLSLHIFCLPLILRGGFAAAPARLVGLLLRDVKIVACRLAPVSVVVFDNDHLVTMASEEFRYSAIAYIAAGDREIPILVSLVHPHHRHAHGVNVVVGLFVIGDVRDVRRTGCYLVIDYDLAQFHFLVLPLIVPAPAPVALAFQLSILYYSSPIL